VILVPASIDASSFNKILTALARAGYKYHGVKALDAAGIARLAGRVNKLLLVEQAGDGYRLKLLRGGALAGELSVPGLDAMLQLILSDDDGGKDGGGGRFHVFILDRDADGDDIAGMLDAGVLDAVEKLDVDI